MRQFYQVATRAVFKGVDQMQPLNYHHHYLQYQCTAGIISLLTHICTPVALNIDVHPKVTYEHQSPYHQGLHTQLCNPSCSDSCKP